MSEPLIRRINREQMLWRAVDVEQLIGEDHVARAIWDLVGRMHLDGFYQGIECSEEEGGRPAYDPRLLISLWIYAYSRGIGSAREVARRCEWEPAFEWLTGCQVVNYPTLASFRVEHRGELDELFTQVLGLMSAEGLITLEQVVQDGTKIKAQGRWCRTGPRSRRRRQATVFKGRRSLQSTWNGRGDGFEKWENRIRNPSRAGWSRHDGARDANGNS